MKRFVDFYERSSKWLTHIAILIFIPLFGMGVLLLSLALYVTLFLALIHDGNWYFPIVMVILFIWLVMKGIYTIAKHKLENDDTTK